MKEPLPISNSLPEQLLTPSSSKNRRKQKRPSFWISLGKDLKEVRIGNSKSLTFAGFFDSSSILDGYKPNKPSQPKQNKPKQTKNKTKQNKQ